MVQRSMHRVRLIVFAVLAIATVACGGSQSASSISETESTSQSETGSEQSAEEGAFQLHRSDTAGQAHGERPSEIQATATMAAMRLFVVDPDAGPISGIVIKMTGPDGTAYFTDETDSVGYAEVLVPVGARYEIEYLSLGRRSVATRVDVPSGPNQDIRLTMRHRSRRPRRAAQGAEASTLEQASEPEPGFVLEGVLFESGRATIQAESYPRLDRLVEYLSHHSGTRIRIAGHTDNVGNPRVNEALSEQRAQAVRDYLIEHGIESTRIEAVGYGDQQPIASNDTQEGRQQNRRIEAIEL